MFNKYLIIIFILIILQGCASMHNYNDNHVYKDVETIIENKYPDIGGIEKTKPPHIDFEIENIDYLENIAKSDFSQTKLDIFFNVQTPLDVALELVSTHIPVDVIGIDVNDISLKPSLVKGDVTFISFLKRLKYSYDLHIVYDESKKVIFVNKNKKISFILPSILNSLQGTIGSQDTFAVDAHPDSLKDVIDSYADSLEVEINVFSETTGNIELYGKPSNVDTMIRVIEEEVKERLKFVMLHISFVTLSSTNNMQSNFDLVNSSIKLIDSGTIGTFKFDTSSIFQSKGNMFEFGVDNTKHKINSLFTLFNSIGNATIKTAPSVMTANGVPVSFDVLDEVGYWEPGDLESRSYEGETIWMAGKPTFVEESVGLELKIRPKIISSRSGEFIEMDISFSKSEIYGTTSMSWQQQIGMETTLLEKPLKREKRLSSRSVLRPEELLLLAKLDDTNKSMQKGGLPFNNSLLDFFTTAQDKEGREQILFVVIDAVIQDENLYSDYQIYEENHIDFSVIIDEE